eukprot:PITA_28199
MVTAIGSNAIALQFDEIVLALLTEEMRRKTMDNQNGDALSVRGRSHNRNKIKSSSGRSKSPGEPINVVCWKCGKEGPFRRDCKSKSPNKGKGSDDAPSVEAKTTSDKGGDVYLASSSTHVDHEAWLIDSGVKTVFEKDTCKMVRGALVLMRGVRIGTLYKLQGSTVVDGCNSSMVPENGAENLVVSGEKTMLGHQRLGHIGEKGLRVLHGKGMVEGMSNSSLDFDLCENCVYGKKNQLSFASGEAVETSCYLVNRSPSSTLQDKTSHEVWTGKKPSVSHLRVFRCDAYVHVLKEKRTKLDSKSKKCIFIGYKDGLKGYKIWNRVTRKVVYIQDVVFREVKDVIKNEFPSKELEKIKFELKEEESNSTTEEE